jgi:phosphodiesterase/alkaline phosphatase D-like protein
MAWVVAAALAGIVALLIVLYRRALNEVTRVNALLILVLLEDDVYKAQRNGLIDFITNTSAKNALDLSTKVHASLRELAARLERSSVLGAHGHLWKLKQESGTKPE